MVTLRLWTEDQQDARMIALLYSATPGVRLRSASGGRVTLDCRDDEVAYRVESLLDDDDAVVRYERRHGPVLVVA